jgi:MFS family permease
MMPVAMPIKSPDSSSDSPPLEVSIFKNRSFMALWWSQVLSQLADRIIFVVFVTYLTHVYGGDERLTSYLYVAFTIPAILLTAVAGVFVDRWPRRLTLVVINVLRSVLVFSLPWMAHAGIAYLYTLAFLLSAVTQFFVPAESATIPTIVSKDQLLSANSLFTTTMMASVIVGFALGDPLIEVMGLAEVHWALSLLFILAAVALFDLRLDRNMALTERVDPTKPRYFGDSLRRFSSELKEGFTYIRTHTTVWHAMAKLALLFSAVVALCILSITFAKTFLYTDPTLAARKFSYIVASAGVGMALGAIGVSQGLKQVPAPFIVYGGMLLLSMGLAAMVLVPQVFPDLASLGVSVSLSKGLPPLVLTDRMIWTYVANLMMGLGAAGVAIPLQAFLHDCIPEAIRGKVLGVQFTLLSTSSTLPALIAGLSAHFLGVQMMMSLLALPFLAWGGYGLYLIIFKKMRSFHPL